MGAKATPQQWDGAISRRWVVWAVMTGLVAALIASVAGGFEPLVILPLAPSL